MRTGVLVAIAVAAAACGSSDTPTSVYLEIYDASVIPSPTQVSLDVFNGPGGNQIATLDRTAAAQTSPASPLGSVVILVGTSASSGTLHIEARRSSGGAMTSSGSVDVPLIANRQVSAQLMLGHAGQPSDAGAGGAGGSGNAGASGTGAGGSGGSATPPADAAPPVDSGSTLAPTGTDCRAGSACASGFCVDSVCCDSACDSLCHGCNLSGSRGACKSFAAGSQCVPPSCTSTGDDLVPARTCDANGNCNAAGAAQSCGRYRCQSDACLRSCSSTNACVSPFRCFQNRCQ